MKNVKEIVQFIFQHDRFVLTSHVRPDGDSIASQLAMAEALEQLGKHAEIYDRDPFPPNYRSLPGVERIHVGEPVKGEFDAVIVLECANLKRADVEGLDAFPAINIDHHPVNDMFGVLNWVDPSASAVGEMLYLLFSELGTQFTPDMATNLYTAILTDTGSFQFSNTTARTFRIASDLVSAGADPAWIAQVVLMSQSEARVRLIGRLIDTLDFDSSRKIAWVRLDREMFTETGAARNDTEGLVNYPLSVDGVELCAFFREEHPGEYRISLRSQGDLDVCSVASRFGGGGHRNAAGVTLQGSFEEVRRTVIDALSELLATEREQG